MDNFHKTMLLQLPENKVYEALTNSIPKWWTEMYEGISNEQGRSFTIRFGTNVFKTMMVEELIPNRKVVWFVSDAMIDIPELQHKSEWINTKIIWEITPGNSSATLHLTHLGLTPEVECYNICETGWHEFNNSLTQFINTGIGNPFSKKNK